MSKVSNFQIFILCILISISAIAAALLIAAKTATPAGLVCAAVLAYLGSCISSYSNTLHRAKLIPALIIGWIGALLALALLLVSTQGQNISEFLLPTPVSSYLSLNETIAWYTTLLKTLPVEFSQALARAELIGAIVFPIAYFHMHSPKESQS